MKLTPQELTALLADIPSFTIECHRPFNNDEGSNIHRETIDWYFGPFNLHVEVIIISSWVPSQPINDGGYLKFEAPEVTHVINFDGITSLNLDGESIITDVQALEIEARLQYLINIE